MEPLTRGALLHGRYRVVRLIGQGGMGAVYEAVDGVLDSTVALKQMLHGGPESDRAFSHEAKILASLRHPALPVVIDYFIEHSGVFLVMQFIEGDDLSRVLQSQGQPCAIADVLTWAEAVLEVLKYLHGHNPCVIHRDIKPSNLRRTPAGAIVLLDFGLSKSRRESETTRTDGRSTFGYTPRYAPPEQIDSRTTDARSDLYSLGATLYHLLTGNAPSTATERLVALNAGDPDPMTRPSVGTTALETAFHEVLGQALELRPDRRFQTAEEMYQAVKRCRSQPDGERRTPAAPAASLRRVDAAIPTTVELGKQTDLLVQVRFASSPLLGVEDWPTRRKPTEIEQASDPIQLAHPVDSATGRMLPARVRIKVVAPDFVLAGNSEYFVAVPPDDYSKRVFFLLSPNHAGVCRVNVEVYDVDAVMLGSIAVEAIAAGVGAIEPEWRVGNLVLQFVNQPSTGFRRIELESARAQAGRARSAPERAAPAQSSLPPTLPMAAGVAIGRDSAPPYAVPRSGKNTLAAGERRRVRLLAVSTSSAIVVAIGAAVLFWRVTAVPSPVTGVPAVARNTPAIGSKRDDRPASADAPRPRDAPLPSLPAPAVPSPTTTPLESRAGHLGTPAASPSVADKPPLPPLGPDEHAKQELAQLVSNYCAALNTLNPATIAALFNRNNQAELSRQFKDYKSLKCTVTSPPEYDRLDAREAGGAQLKFGMKQMINVGDVAKPVTIHVVATMVASRKNFQSPWLIERVSLREMPNR